MKRLMLTAMLVVITLALPVATAAQTSGPADTEVPVDTFGDGWSAEFKESTGTTQNPWRKRSVFLGPNGSRVMVLAFNIGDSIADRSAGWERMKGSLSGYVGQHALLADVSGPLGSAAETPPPNGVSDWVRSEFIDAFAQPVGYGIYAIDGTRIAIMVIVEGAVNDLTGVAAADYVAGLYIAALSAE